MPRSKTNPTLWLTLIFAAGLVALVLYLGRATSKPDESDQDLLAQDSAASVPTQEPQALPEPVVEPVTAPPTGPALELTQGRSDAASHEAATTSAPLTLVEAADAGDVDRLREMLSAGADVNTPDAEGMTLLMRAARGGHLEAVFLLLDFGANPSIADTGKMTAADHASIYPQIVQVLSGASAPITEPDPTK